MDRVDCNINDLAKIPRLTFPKHFRLYSEFRRPLGPVNLFPYF